VVEGPFGDHLRDKAAGLLEKVSADIDPLRKDIYRVKDYTDTRLTYSLWRWWVRNRRLTAMPEEGFERPGAARTGGAGLPDQIARLEARAEWYEIEARKSQKEVLKLKLVSPDTLLRITNRAGEMLYWTEDLIVEHERLSQEATKAKVAPPSPLVQARTMTVVATARDHISSAQGHLDNIKDVLASLARRLIFGYLFTFAALYVMLHPISPFPWVKVSQEFLGQWDVFFWSVFGALTISLVYTAEDVAKPAFDIRAVWKWAYRLMVAAPIAFGLLLMLDTIGFAPGGAPLVDFSNPDYPTFRAIAFFAGVTGRGALEAMGNLWHKYVGK